MKTKRQAMIIKLIASQNVETQEELAALLSKQGFSVTQATVSRDIKEMRLLKVLTSDGGYKYATVEKAEFDMQERFIRLFSNCVLTVTGAGNIVVVKTMAGSAAVAAEAIDSLQWPEVAGCIAGDNTIFVAAREGKSVTELVKRFQKLISR
ncbi:MAG: arginine repressor [Clostridiales bacterium]|nr:arginine repressor [Clostridiales bacterium]